MKDTRAVKVGLVCLIAALAISEGRTQSSSGADVRKAMSAQEYKDAGLDKLSPNETAAINNWLTTFIFKARFASGSKSGVSVSRENAEAVESAIDGEFEGWTGETIFKLQNGQIWQQAEYDYNYEYDSSPDVTIYKTSSCWKMQVKGVEDTICVKRLK